MYGRAGHIMKENSEKLGFKQNSVSIHLTNAHQIQRDYSHF